MSLLPWKISVWWNADPLRKRACMFALFLHLIGFGFLVFSPCNKTVKTTSKLVVRTITASASAPSSVQAPSKSKTPPIKASPTPTLAPAEKAPLPKKQSAQPIKTPAKTAPKNAPKPLTKKQVTKSAPPKPKAPPKLPAVKPSQELQKSLEKIEETIAKIATKSDTMPAKRTLSVAPKIEIESDSFSAMTPLSEEEEYISLLVHYLQSHLELPDVGEVKVAITLRKDGSIDAVKVVTAESERNRKRLEEELPTLRFPSFPKEMQGMKTKAFILNFCNEI